MDARIRELQRLVSLGDEQARRTLEAIYARLGRDALSYTGPEALGEPAQRGSRQAARAERLSAMLGWCKDSFSKRVSRRAGRRSGKQLCRDWESEW